MKIPMLKPFLLTMLLSVVTAFAHASSWQPRVDDAVWEVSSSIFECRLVQPIPRYGQAVFDTRAGESPRFYLDPEKNLMEGGEANIRLEAPAWKRGEQQRHFGSVTVNKTGYRGYPVVLDEKMSDQLLSELALGYAPIFSRSSNYSDADNIQVGLLPVNFKRAFQDYRRCLVGLLPANFEQISRSKVHFDTGKYNLNEDARVLLDLIAVYMKGDVSVNEVYIDGYTDSVGRKISNIELSKKRSETVLDYLVDAGISDDLVITRYHGQLYPLAKNNSDVNRAKNRRVTIRLDRVSIEDLAEEEEVDDLTELDEEPQEDLSGDV
ncbi:MAG: OmpA family protein [Pseudomonadales bacterium]|nr:OmpA family protein [Pseudomonadales bacterium]